MTLESVRTLKLKALDAYTKALSASRWSQNSGGGGHSVQRQTLSELLKQVEYWENLEAQILGKMQRIKVGTPTY